MEYEQALCKTSFEEYDKQDEGIQPVIQDFIHSVIQESENKCCEKTKYSKV
jgi:hypothetical protein